MALQEINDDAKYFPFERAVVVGSDIIFPEEFQQHLSNTGRTGNKIEDKIEFYRLWWLLFIGVMRQKEPKLYGVVHLAFLDNDWELQG